MTRANTFIIGSVAILALIISIPLEWMTLHNAKMNFPGLFSQSLVLTGFNGHITILAPVPFWALVLLGLVGAVVALLNGLSISSLPRIVVLVPLLLSLLHVGAALMIPHFSDGEATLGIGGFVAFIGLALALEVNRPHRDAQLGR